MSEIKIAVVDDHKLISRAIEEMLSINPNYNVVYTAANGEEFLDMLKTKDIHPDIVLMDINMPFKNGIETTDFITKNYPKIRVIALTMEDNENTIIKMMRVGARGYLLKDMTSHILFDAIDTVYRSGSFYTDFLTQKIKKIKDEENKTKEIMDSLSDNELQFIKLACSEMTYKEIAEIMELSPKTIDGYRNAIFSKFDIKSRVGIVLFATKYNLL